MKPFFTTLFIFIFSALLSSCSEKNVFHYEDNSEEFMGSVQCLVQNYSRIFSSSNIGNSVSLYPDDFIENKFCTNTYNLLKAHSIDFVTVDRDSAIAFYRKSKKGLKEIQSILMFAGDSNIVRNKITSGTKIIAQKDSICYELERVISLAN